MNEIILNVNYIIEGIISTIPTKFIYEETDINEINSIHYEFNMGKCLIISEASDSTEYAVANIQKALPENVTIACCHSCKHGNFSPYGNNENEIFCLKDRIFNDKSDLCMFFNEKIASLQERCRLLLDFCKDYKPISHDDYYIYNDWDIKYNK